VVSLLIIILEFRLCSKYGRGWAKRTCYSYPRIFDSGHRNGSAIYCVL